VDPDQLDPTERVIFNSYASNLFVAFENLFALVNEGSYDESRARGYWQVFRNMLEYAGTWQHWERTQYIYNDAFREHVKNEVMALEPLRGTSLLPANE